MCRACASEKCKVAMRVHAIGWRAACANNCFSQKLKSLKEIRKQIHIQSTLMVFCLGKASRNLGRITEKNQITNENSQTE